jgi:hypothetical protein
LLNGNTVKADGCVPAKIKEKAKAPANLSVLFSSFASCCYSKVLNL